MENKETIKEWAPLIAEDLKDDIAMTRINYGSDVDFESLSHQMLKILSTNKKFSIHVNHEIKSISQADDKTWDIKIYCTKRKKVISVNAKFIFIGAGGSTIHLLQKSNIKNQIGYAGFPINGEWLICKKSSLTKKHFSKIYGLAGLRVGWGYASKEIIKGLNQVKPPFNVNRPALFAATAAILDISWLKKEINHIEAQPETTQRATGGW